MGSGILYNPRVMFLPPLKKRFIIGAVIILLTVIAVTLALVMKDKSPSEEMEAARNAIAQARSARADLYSKMEFSEAVHLYNSAMEYWRTENSRFFFLRDYSRARDLAGKSAEQAIQALGRAMSQSGEITDRLQSGIRSLHDQLGNFQQLFDRLPLKDDVIKENIRGFLLLSEAEVHYKRGAYGLGMEKLRQAENCILNSYGNAGKLLEDYFSHYGEWEKNASESIHRSTVNRTRMILVDKMAGKLYIYIDGNPEYSFDVEMGLNWMGDKRQKGDRATPEGQYKIVTKKWGSQTKYYKALLLDYPNEDDQKHFILERNNGLLNKSSEIGGHIEIHGHGGKGLNWTDGCIALKNDDMDTVYRLVAAGMPVTIVGSLKPLNEFTGEQSN